MSAEDVANRFVAAINQHDVEAIYELMSKDHRIIDSGGGIVEGREEMKEAWIKYFKMVPDYQVSISEVFVSENTVVLLGKASGTYTADGVIKSENLWQTTAAWRAVVSGEQISEWQIFADLEPIREIMRRESPSNGA